VDDVVGNPAVRGQEATPQILEHDPVGGLG
jgi:hypothetical protein